MGTGCTNQVMINTKKLPKTNKMHTAELTDAPLDQFLADSSLGRTKFANSVLQKIEMKKKKEISTANEIYEDLKVQKKSKTRTKELETSNLKQEMLIEGDLSAIQAFMDEFEQVKKSFNDKKIKVIRAVGEIALSAMSIEEIEKSLKKRNENFSNLLISENLHRTDFKGQDSFPIYDLNIQIKEPAWNIKDKDDKAIRQLQVKRLVAFTNKLIIKQRASKRLKKIKDFTKFAFLYQQQNQIIKTDLKQDRYLELQRAADFKFDLNEIFLTQKSFPSQHENAIPKYNINFVDVPIVWSEDLLNLNEIKRNDLEVEYYENVDPFKNYLYKPVIEKPNFKKGAEDEYLCSTEINNSAKFQKIVELYPNTEIAEIFKSQKDTGEDAFFTQLSPHRAVPIPQSDENELIQYDNLLQITEADYYKVFDHRPINYPDPTLMNQYEDIETVKREYISSSNGYNFMKFFLPMRLEKYNYFVKKYNKNDKVWGDTMMDRYCPEYIKNIELDDKKYIEDIELNYEKLKEEKAPVKKELAKGQLKNDKNSKKALEFVYEPLTLEQKMDIIAKASRNQEEFEMKLINEKKVNILSAATRNSDLNKYIIDPKDKVLI